MSKKQTGVFTDAHAAELDAIEALDLSSEDSEAVRIAGYIMSDQYLYPRVRWDDARAMAKWILRRVLERNE